LGQAPWLAKPNPVRRSRLARAKILDTLVEILGDAASDAGSTPAASTKPNPAIDEVVDFVADERNEPRYNSQMTVAELVSQEIAHALDGD